eukprot:TRINITY_DN2319_c0_g4_i1.p1 TRINITY_DN2319_c0_g4~~TRINITY_DN2319_c0_g4_i1.p1  ORF type:complete len:173 (+),score=41.31 TRINITY_DN2319_c0_g4_i1:76-594(+)
MPTPYLYQTFFIAVSVCQTLLARHAPVLSLLFYIPVRRLTLLRYSAMRDQYMRTGQGFILTYAITSRQSYDEMNVFRDQIHRVKDADHVPIVLAGNKCDLEDERQVTKQEASDLAKQWLVPMYETSALARINVEEVFFDLVREIRKDLQKSGGGGGKGGKPSGGRRNGCMIL